MPLVDEQKEGEGNMCEAIRQMRESSRAEGKAEGMIEAFYEMGLSPEEIAQRIGITLAEVEKYLSQLQA